MPFLVCRFAAWLKSVCASEMKLLMPWLCSSRGVGRHCGPRYSNNIWLPRFCFELVILFSFALRGSYVAQVICAYQAFSSRADLKKAHRDVGSQRFNKARAGSRGLTRTYSFHWCPRGLTKAHDASGLCDVAAHEDLGPQTINKARADLRRLTRTYLFHCRSRGFTKACAAF